MKSGTKLHNFIINATIVCCMLFAVGIFCTFISWIFPNTLLGINPTIFFISTIVIGIVSVFGMIVSILLSKS